MWRIVFIFLFLALCGGCAQIPFPAGHPGDVVRDFYKSTTAESSEALSDLETPADRAAVTPALLAIVNENHNPRSLYAASVLSQWSPKVAATAPEFRRILPAVRQGLSATNEESPPQWTALSSTFLLARMGTPAITSSCSAISQRFVAPVSEPIVGESNECWTRYALMFMLVFNGSDGVPALIKGLDHPDPFVRNCALLGLADEGQLAACLADYPDTQQGFPAFTPQQIAAARRAARTAIPKITDRLWDQDDQVLAQACRALAALAESTDATPRMVNRLLELLARSEADCGMSAGDALAALHPAATPQLISVALSDTDLRAPGARVALAHVGAPAVSALVALLPEEQHFPLGHIAPIFTEMGAAALPGLAAALHGDKNPLIRQRAAACYRTVYDNAAQEVKRYLSILDDPDPNMRSARIKLLLQYAPAAACALPTLDHLATSDPNADVRTEARAAAEKIRAVQLPPPAVLQ